MSRRSLASCGEASGRLVSRVQRAHHVVAIQVICRKSLTAPWARSPRIMVMMCRTQFWVCAINALSHTTTVVVDEFHSMQGTLCVTPFFA